LLTEQTILRTSILVNFLVATFRIVFGLLPGLFSIAFDGTCALVNSHVI